MNIGNIAADAARLETIIAGMESIEDTSEETSSTVNPAKCEVCDT